ncbi:MAG: hypothetical protein J2O49_00715, partial [Sciscionella sp.]|nr:hypothetical protein [Sciscionella sp.]
MSSKLEASISVNVREVPVELRARDGKAVLCERAHSSPDEHADEHADVHADVHADLHEMDPDRLPLGAALSSALHEWAQVADAVGAIDGERDKAGALVSRRGRQLAGRVAAALGVPIDYADPV